MEYRAHYNYVGKVFRTNYLVERSWLEGFGRTTEFQFSSFQIVRASSRALSSASYILILIGKSDVASIKKIKK